MWDNLQLSEKMVHRGGVTLFGTYYKKQRKIVGFVCPEDYTYSDLTPHHM